MPQIFARALLLPLALVMLVTAGVGQLAAQEATPVPGSLVLPPDATVGGMSVGEWTAQAWQWQLSFPLASNPVLDATGERCALGQTGPVFFLLPPPVVADASQPRDVTRRCTVPTGVALLVPLLTTECSTVEAPPFFGRDETELRRCAAANIDAAPAQILATLALTVDGQNVVDLRRYLATSPHFTFYVPSDNLLHLAGPTVADAVSDGYWVLLAPLPTGDHQIAISGPSPEGPATATYHLTVEAPQVTGAAAPPVASPGA